LKVCSFEISGKKRLGILDGQILIDASKCGDSFLDDLLTTPPEETRRKLLDAPRFRYRYEYLRLPIQPGEVWGAGVTYLRSREAREGETAVKGIYDRVYSATRPEVFLKDSGIRTVGPGEPISVRSDSKWSVPEPELGVVVGPNKAVLGFTICNDVSARDIEGENPLYLSQSKIYKNSCAIGPVVTTSDEISNPRNLQIAMNVIRNRRNVFEGDVNTSRMKRTVKELLSFLFRNNVISGWTVLMTGTGIVPPDDFSLRDGDIVEIEIENIGKLRNPVVKLR
jgi:2-dehydro-3-deoxy-D-arabinonate dehydratase